jgi:hypothetical protein
LYSEEPRATSHDIKVPIIRKVFFVLMGVAFCYIGVVFLIEGVAVLIESVAFLDFLIKSVAF